MFTLKTDLRGFKVRPSACFIRQLKRKGGHLDETSKTEAPYHSRCGKIKIPPCSKDEPQAKALTLQPFIGNGDLILHMEKKKLCETIK